MEKTTQTTPFLEYPELIFLVTNERYAHLYGFELFDVIITKLKMYAFLNTEQTLKCVLA